MPCTVLIVEGINSQFSDFLDEIRKRKLQINLVKSSIDALEYLSHSTPSLLLLDLLIDKKDAIDLLSEAKLNHISHQCTKVVFSDRRENYVEITTLNAGADDFMVKPVNKYVFTARLDAWLRKHQSNSNTNGSVVQYGDIVLDKDQFTAFVDEREVALQRKEFEIIQLLVSKPRKVFSRIEIKENVWIEVQNVRNRTIDVHIRNLRSKIGSRYIKTYKGVGYSYNG